MATFAEAYSRISEAYDLLRTARRELEELHETKDVLREIDSAISHLIEVVPE